MKYFLIFLIVGVFASQTTADFWEEAWEGMKGAAIGTANTIKDGAVKIYTYSGVPELMEQGQNLIDVGSSLIDCVKDGLDNSCKDKLEEAGKNLVQNIPAVRVARKIYSVGEEVTDVVATTDFSNFDAIDSMEELLYAVGRGLTNEGFKMRHEYYLREGGLPAPGDVKFFCAIGDGEFREIKAGDKIDHHQVEKEGNFAFIIHGFRAGFETSGWMKKTANVWIDYTHTVCAVDWSKLAANLDYPTVSTRDTKRVANAVVEFMMYLVKEIDLNIEGVEMMGHSLGAHIAGYVGSTFGGKFSVIYGLDPAGLGFTSMSEVMKLDKSDADYVQCIYSDGDLFGTDTKHDNCHANFFVNGGEDQPACSILKAEHIVDALDPSCDHSIAIDYFRLSFDEKHEFWGVECPISSSARIEDLPMDRLGPVGGGLWEYKEQKRYCVETKAEYPYAIPKDQFLAEIKRFREDKNKRPNTKFWKMVLP